MTETCSPPYIFAHLTASEMDKHGQQNAWDTNTGDFPSMLILLTLETTQMTKNTVNLPPFLPVLHFTG